MASRTLGFKKASQTHDNDAQAADDLPGDSDKSGARFREFSRAEIEQPIVARFEEQAALHAQAWAVQSPDHSWTYANLAGRVTAVASAILAHSDLSGRNVALMFDHGAPMSAGMLGALKGGKTYVPLDPDYPQMRLEFMLADSEAYVIVVDRNTVEAAQALASAGTTVIDIDDPIPELVSSFPSVSPDEAAYILYTSGSTGTPKGVVQNHRNVLHFIRNYCNNLQLSPDDRMTLFSSYRLDAAVMAIYGAVLTGACLYPLSIAELGFSAIGPWLLENEISIYYSTPTVYRGFLNSCETASRFPDVRHVVLGGEAALRRDADLFRRCFGESCILINGLVQPNLR